MTPTLITDVEQVSREWLQDVLRTHGYLPQGEITSFTKTVSKPFGAPTVHIEVGYSQPVILPTRFLLKIDGPDSLAGNREVEFYTRYGWADLNLPTVRCFDAVYDETQRAYHLLLEDLTATHYMVEREAPPTQTEAERMIDALAALHAGWWDKVDESVALIDNGLLTEPPSFFASFVDFIGERLSVRRRKLYEQIVQCLPSLLKQRLDHGLTLVHDDAHTWNFLHPRAPQTDQIVLVDWQQWGRSIGAHDVAYHISLFWYPEYRRLQEQAMLRRYYDGLQKHGVTDYSFENCWDDYRLYVIRNMLVPLWAFHYGHWAPHRWMQMEKSWFAFDDLSCVELLSF
jgi:hypothetical protein